MQLELSEIEPATCTATRAVTLYLFCDTILLAERVSSGLRFLTWTSVLDMSLTSVGHQSRLHSVTISHGAHASILENVSGLYFRYIGEQEDCNEYWTERTMRQYTVHNDAQGRQFNALFYDNWAALRMKGWSPGGWYACFFTDHQSISQQLQNLCSNLQQ
jgi:hypothetical protein